MMTILFSLVAVTFFINFPRFTLAIAAALSGAILGFSAWLFFLIAVGGPFATWTAFGAFILGPVVLAEMAAFVID